MIDLTTLTAVELRKVAARAGIKGASRGRKADLLVALGAKTLVCDTCGDEVKSETDFPAHNKSNIYRHLELTGITAKAYAEDVARSSKVKCAVCNRRPRSTAAQRKEAGMARDFSDMCVPCFNESSWENTHSDNAHDDILNTWKDSRTEAQKEEIKGCWICFPELNEAKRAYTPRGFVSRTGQIVLAKGTEAHKSQTFKALAEAQGWTVTIQTENNRHFADAHRGDDAIQLAWDGRAYDYPHSSAVLAGKERKVRNLKEAVRLLEA